ncbi:hypothetical protein [Nocardia transvalensis]|uniref:hypothetical protein n=1 Tax=Nocardia transvalensis TaxID=37333 RepID=UPI001893437E|nr:hypothetical protein [Nocardia transvalensis]MBF6328507.1 hypothetical protein [Nocardia transvalensis]
MPDDNDASTPSDTTETADTAPTDDTVPTDMFPRSYVEKLRDENAKYRQRAGRADEYAQRLHAELVRATGRLADPTDLPFDPDHLTDTEKMTTAIDALLARKPHLATRTPVGDIGQGAAPSTSTVDLASLLRERAR